MKGIVAIIALVGLAGALVYFVTREKPPAHPPLPLEAFYDEDIGDAGCGN